MKGSNLLSTTDAFNQNTQEFIWGLSWFQVSCFTDPLKKASFEAGSGLKPFPLQILKETLHLRLELVWSILLYKSLKKSFIWGWSWFEAFCFTDPLDPWETLHLRLELVWCSKTLVFLKEIWVFDQKLNFYAIKQMFWVKNSCFP